MPELPEVEVVRRGLVRWVVGRTITGVDVVDRRSIRRHLPGVVDFTSKLEGAVVLDAVRRGKFLWLPLGAGPAGEAHPRVALMAHLGMSGQLLMQEPDVPEQKHLKVRLRLSMDEGKPGELRFVDQRIFGGLFITGLVPTSDGFPGGLGESADNLIPVEAAHIARDPLDPAFSFEDFFTRLRKRRSGLKRVLLDQGMISGIGNIYADEALWRARLHFARPTETLRRAEALTLLGHVQDVMNDALAAGGTSFDSLYVNVNGASGYFSRSLNVYGREGETCSRCAGRGLATRIRREQFMNRSSHTCPVCQPRPRNAHR